MEKTGKYGISHSEPGNSCPYNGKAAHFCNGKFQVLPDSAPSADPVRKKDMPFAPIPYLAHPLLLVAQGKYEHHRTCIGSENRIVHECETKETANAANHQHQHCLT
jgi:hypothetical protein